MPRITLTKETFARLRAFLQVGEAVVDGEMSLDAFAEALILQAMNDTLAHFWLPLDSAVLVRTLQQLAERHPEQVYSYVAEVLRSGSEVQREEARQRIGFRSPEGRG